MAGRVPRWVIALAASAVALGACGEQDASRSSTKPQDVRAIELQIRHDDGARRIASARLVCRAGEQRATGYLAARQPTADLCREVRSLTSLLTEKPGRRMCTQIYGGPQTVHVTGTIDGRRVDRRFGRTNGCEIGEYRRLAPLLPRER